MGEPCSSAAVRTLQIAWEDTRGESGATLGAGKITVDLVMTMMGTRKKKVAMVMTMMRIKREEGDDSDDNDGDKEEESDHDYLVGGFNPFEKY